MDALVRGDRAEQTLHGLPQPDLVPVGEQVLQERVLGLDEQVRQRVRVGGVPGLGLACLRHLQIGEEHFLQLFRRAEVHLPADHGIGLLGR